MGQFDFYVLALSWSPGFCENSGSQAGNATTAAASAS